MARFADNFHSFLWAVTCEGQDTDVLEKLKSVHQYLLDQAASNINEQQANNLQKILNEEFYPTSTKEQQKAKSFREALMQQYKSEVEERLHKTILPQDFLQEAPQSVRQISHTYKHKAEITRSRIDKLLEKARQALDYLNKHANLIDTTSFNGQTLETVCQDIDSKIKEIDQQLYQNLDLQKVTTAQKYQSIWTTIISLENLLNQLQTKPLADKKATGDLFERLLAFYSLKNSKQITAINVEGMLEQFAKLRNTVTLAQSYASRGNQLGNETFQQNGIIINNYINKVQAKTDIVLELPNNNTFKISAKNWGTMSGNFGNTSISAALIRSLTNLGSTSFENLSIIELTMGAQTLKLYSAQEEVDKILQLSLATDILRGNFSDNSNNANVIVINDRSAQQIRVYSIAELLKNYDKRLKFNGYDYWGRILSYAQKIAEWCYADPDVITTMYYNSLLANLSNMQVSVSLKHI